jgi:hypothetical protein
MEDIFKAKIRKKDLHEISNDNGVRAPITVFACSNSGVLSSNPTRGMGVCLYSVFFFLVLCRERPCEGPIPRPRGPTDFLHD